LGLIYFKGYYTPAQNHFLHLKKNAHDLKQVEIQSLLGSYTFSNNYRGKIISWGNHKTTGSILIRQDKDSTTKVWSSGQKILTNKIIVPIKKSLNPGQFSYKDYLANKKITHQLNLNSTNCIVLSSKSKTLRSYCENLERKAFEKIEQTSLSSSSQGMLKALLFADRNALDEKIKNDYAKAGVIHLLALSGLHIGLIVGFLLIVLKPLEKLKYGYLLRSISVILFLWLFAFFIGFPPSVTRAVCMFSFIVIGRALHFGKSTFHYTLLSFFVLLLFHPPYLKSIGFQLSYLAVFGILLIHPLLQRLWNPQNLFLKRYWEWTTVCLAAQTAVSPVSIHYFHQFPSLFLVSNLLIIPFFGLFLIFCMLVFFILLFAPIPVIVVNVFEETVRLLNKSVGWVAQQEAFLFEGMFHSITTTLLLYCLLVCLVLWGYRKKLLMLIPIGLTLAGLFFNLTHERKITSSENSFWVFHRYNASLIGHLKNSYFYYCSLDSETTHSLLTDFSNSRPLTKMIPVELSNIYIQDDLRLLIIDSDAPFDLPDFDPNYILLRANPKVNIERLLNRYKPAKLIADGSNGPWNLALWEKTCTEQGVEFYNTREKGALRISL
jgi:competence protein ComEC